MPYSFSVSARRLVEPIGGVFRYAAKLESFYRTTESGDVQVNPGLGECYGATEAEAKAKLRDYVDEWIGLHGERS